MTPPMLPAQLPATHHTIIPLVLRHSTVFIKPAREQKDSLTYGVKYGDVIHGFFTPVAVFYRSGLRMRPTRIEFTDALRHNCRYFLGFAA